MTDKIIDEVRRALDALDKDTIANLTTKDVQTALCNACRQCDPEFELYASTTIRGEWLFDVTCLRRDDDGYLKRVALVAECERYSQEEVYDDFEKLLLARADVRVMVFNGNRWPDDERFAVFAEYIKRCDHTVIGDTYLLAARVSNPERFQYCRIDACQAQRILE